MIQEGNVQQRRKKRHSSNFWEGELSAVSTTVRVSRTGGSARGSCRGQGLLLQRVIVASTCTMSQAAIARGGDSARSDCLIEIADAEQAGQHCRRIERMTAHIDNYANPERIHSGEAS